LAESIKKELGVEVQLIKSGGGVFEIMADQRRIFSKKKEHRFPEPGEILESLRNS
jgi:selT/selW/selH-like putative selenoprotein